jgi:hypothetical protein
MRKVTNIILVGIFIVLLVPNVEAQLKQDYEYSSEVIWGINKNTNDGLIGGFILKYGRERRENTFETFGLELINVKHPKEERTQTPNGSTFIWGKEKYLYSIRFQYGREKILFKKAPQQGVQISASLAGGPTIGVVAPYYITISPSGTLETRTVPFDMEKHGNQKRNIIGTGGVFQGIGESTIQPGINAKTSLNFEFGTFKRHVTGFEVGFLVEAFAKEIVIIPNTENKSVFTSAFITLFYGARK